MTCKMETQVNHLNHVLTTEGSLGGSVGSWSISRSKALPESTDSPSISHGPFEKGHCRCLSLHVYMYVTSSSQCTKLLFHGLTIH